MIMQGFAQRTGEPRWGGNAYIVPTRPKAAAFCSSTKFSCLLQPFAGEGFIPVSRSAPLVRVPPGGWPRRRPPRTRIRSAFLSRATLPQVHRGPASLRTPRISVSRALKNAPLYPPPYPPLSAGLSSTRAKDTHRSRSHNVTSAKVETTYARREAA